MSSFFQLPKHAFVNNPSFQIKKRQISGKRVLPVDYMPPTGHQGNSTLFHCNHGRNSILISREVINHDAMHVLAALMASITTEKQDTTHTTNTNENLSSNTSKDHSPLYKQHIFLPEQFPHPSQSMDYPTQMMIQ